MATSASTSSLSYQGGQIKRTTQVKYQTPPPFTGQIKQYKSWIEAVLLYTRAHKQEFDGDDDATISFILGLMSGEATAWRSAYMQAHSQGTIGSYKPGTLVDFYKELDASFKPASTQADALRELSTLQQGNSSIESFISSFRTLIQQAGIKEDIEAIHHFRNALHPQIAYKTIGLAPETKIDKWFEAARTANQILQAESDFRQQRRYFPTGTSKGYRAYHPQDYSPSYRPHSFQSSTQVNRRDPYAMDVDTLARKTKHIRIMDQSEDEDSSDLDNFSDSSVEEEELPIQNLNPKIQKFINAVFTPAQKDALNKGLCFNCRKPGHYAKDCRSQKAPDSSLDLIRNKKNPKNRAERKKRFQKKYRFIKYMIEDGDEDEVEMIYNDLAEEREENNNIGVDLLKDFA